MNTTQTTNLDLKKTAVTAAWNLQGKDQLQTDAGALEAFTTAGHADLDYPQWRSFFSAELTANVPLATQLTVAAKAAAAVKPATNAATPAA